MLDTTASILVLRSMKTKPADTVEADEEKDLRDQRDSVFDLTTLANVSNLS